MAGDGGFDSHALPCLWMSRDDGEQVRVRITLIEAKEKHMRAAPIAARDSDRQATPPLIADASDRPSMADILDDIRIGLRQAIRGKGMPARAMLEEIQAELKADADKG